MNLFSIRLCHSEALKFKQTLELTPSHKKILNHKDGVMIFSNGILHWFMKS